MSDKIKIVVGISGASGAIYGIKLIELLKENNIEVHTIISENAKDIIKQETNFSIKQIENISDYVYDNSNFNSSVASGSFITNGMIIAPCSITTMSKLSSGITDNLITRTADVTLKERRKLVLSVRESPLHSGHLENMLNLSRIGAVIAPPIPSFYNKPENIDDIITQTCSRILDLFNIDTNKIFRW